ncbi:MAG: hypothetical protein OK456_11015 [Thaumarchaeota archaeon]|nr:hypothetical protein [Nitrososphaerota archaeon]
MASNRLRRHKVGRSRKVLFDSSFLIAVMERPTPWLQDIQEKLGGFEPVVIAPVYAELERLASGNSHAARFASLAKQLVDGGTLKLAGGEVDRADEELVSMALDEGAVVATVDSALIEQLEASGVRVIRLRGGRVEAEGPFS